MAASHMFISGDVARTDPELVKHIFHLYAVINSSIWYYHSSLVCQKTGSFPLIRAEDNSLAVSAEKAERLSA